jgi:hypothetical protein
MASRGKRWLIGCGIGCMSLVLIVAAVIFGFYIWMSQPGELLEPEDLLGSDTTGHVEWTLRLEDPGTNKFVESLLAFSQDQSAKDMEDLNPLLQSWLLKYQGRQNEKKLQELFPLVAAWTIHPGRNPGEEIQLYSLSIEPLGNKLAFADWIMGMTFSRAEGAEVINHQGEKIYKFPTDRGRSVALFIRRNNIFFATDIDAARRAVERLDNPVDAGPSAGEVRELLQGTVADRPLRGALSNERGELRRLWRRLFKADDPGALWDNVLALKIAGGFEEGDNFGGLIELRCIDAAWAGANAESFASALANACERSGLGVETTARVDGEWVAIEFRIEDLPELVKGLLRTGNIRIN